MNLKYNDKDVTYSVNTIIEFTQTSQTSFWTDPFFHFYPDIDREKFESMTTVQQKKYLLEYFQLFEKENKTLILEKLKKYNEHWQLYRVQIKEALEEAFSLKLDNLFNDMQGYISFCPISPRYLENNIFDVFYLNSERGALGVSLHEIIHFVWFHVWNQYFNDNISEYEAPSLKWILSEMTVDIIMRDERLKSINPYFETGCTYSYFYTLAVEEQPILEKLNEMYKVMSIQEFMKESYAVCLKWETQIRKHIKENDNN